MSFLSTPTLTIAAAATKPTQPSLVTKKVSDTINTNDFTKTLERRITYGVSHRAFSSLLISVSDELRALSSTPTTSIPTSVTIAASEVTSYISRLIADAIESIEKAVNIVFVKDSASATVGPTAPAVLSAQPVSSSETVTFSIRQFVDKVTANDFGYRLIPTKDEIASSESALLSVLAKAIERAQEVLALTATKSASDAARLTELTKSVFTTKDLVKVAELYTMSMARREGATVSELTALLYRAITDIVQAFIRSSKVMLSVDERISAQQARVSIPSLARETANDWAALVSFISSKDDVPSKEFPTRVQADTALSTTVSAVNVATKQIVKATESSFMRKGLIDTILVREAIVKRRTDEATARDTQLLILKRHDKITTEELKRYRQIGVTDTIRAIDALLHEVSDTAKLAEHLRLTIMTSDTIKHSYAFTYFYREFYYVVFALDTIEFQKKIAYESITFNDSFMLFKVASASLAEQHLCVTKGYEVVKEYIEQIKKMVAELPYFSYGSPISSSFFNTLLQIIIMAYKVIRCTLIAAIKNGIAISRELLLAYVAMEYLLFDIETREQLCGPALSPSSQR